LREFFFLQRCHTKISKNYKTNLFDFFPRFLIFVWKQIEEQATEYIDEKDAEEAICVYENGPVTVENQVLLPEKENDFEQTSNQVEVSPGAATASGKIWPRYDDQKKTTYMEFI